MTITQEKITNTKSYEENLLEIYSKKPVIMEVLKCALAQEKHYERGVHLNSGTVFIKAKFDDVTGQLQVILEVDHGSVTYTCLDVEMNNINIYSMPNDKYIIGKESMSEAELRTIQINASNSLDINLKDIRTLRKAKDMFKYDYVLKHIPLHHLDHDNAARFIIWHIKAYKKVFFDYLKNYKFLWQGTSFKNAISLTNTMIEKGYVEKNFFDI